MFDEQQCREEAQSISLGDLEREVRKLVEGGTSKADVTKRGIFLDELINRPDPH